MKLFGLDLNCEHGFCDPAKYDFAGMIDESWPAGVRATDAASAVDHVSSLRGPVSRRAQDQVVLLPGPVSVHGLRTADLSGESARHRSVPACAAVQALSPWDSRGGSAQHARQRQCCSRLAHLRRLRPKLDQDRTTAVCRRTLRRRFEGVGLRAGCDHHRSVPVGVFVGTLSLDQGGGQTAHAARSARQHPNLHPHQRRQDARGQHPRSIVARARRVLHHGSGLSRLRTPVSISRSRQLLRNSRQVESPGPAALLASGRPRHGTDLAIKPSFSPASTRTRASKRHCDASASRIPRPPRRWSFSPTTLPCRRSPSPSFIAAVGRSNCSSSG